MEAIRIRRAEQGDLPALLAIYNHYVRETPATFDIEPRTLAQRQAWFDSFAATGRYQCFVAVKDSEPVGWANSYPYKDRPGYLITVETSVYLSPEVTALGLGRELYATLFDALAGEDIHRAYAGIVPPNPASIGLHESFGFRQAGLLAEVGRKFGQFWDVAVYLKSF